MDDFVYGSAEGLSPRPVAIFSECPSGCNLNSDARISSDVPEDRLNGSDEIRSLIVTDDLWVAEFLTSVPRP